MGRTGPTGNWRKGVLGRQQNVQRHRNTGRILWSLVPLGGVGHKGEEGGKINLEGHRQGIRQGGGTETGFLDTAAPERADG